MNRHPGEGGTRGVHAHTSQCPTGGRLSTRAHTKRQADGGESEPDSVATAAQEVAQTGPLSSLTRASAWAEGHT
jgi:hypothetical protein